MAYKAKYAKKTLKAHLDKYEGGSMLTETQIREIVEGILPGATTQKKFRIKMHQKKKDGELHCVTIHFDDHVSTSKILEIKVEIWKLYGILKDGVSDLFPIQCFDASDDFEAYSQVGDNILENLQADHAQWSMAPLADAEDANPPTFKVTSDLVADGEKGGLLNLPVDSTNNEVSIQAFSSVNPETEKLRLEAFWGLKSQPNAGAAFIEFNKVCRVGVFGSRYFDPSGPQADFNGRIVLFSRDPQNPGSEIASVLADTKVATLYRLQLIADVDSLYFDAFLNELNGDYLSVDGYTAVFKNDLSPLVGISQADLQLGELGVKVSAKKSSVAFNPEIDYAVSGFNADHFNLGETGKFSSTCIGLNKGLADGVVPHSKVDCGPVSNFWDAPNVDAFMFEGWFKFEEDPNIPGDIRHAQVLTHLFGIGTLSQPGHVRAYIYGPLKRPGMSIWDAQAGVTRYFYHDSESITVPNQWYHICFGWDGTDTYIGVDGDLRVLSGSTYLNPSALIAPTLDQMSIGFMNYDSYSLRGNADECRLSSIVRYTEDYSVPTGAFTDDDDTFALYHFNDANTKNTAGSVITAEVQNVAGAGLDVPNTKVELVIDEVDVIAEG